MGDISIPGVSSRYNTQKLIQDLLDVEKRKLTRLETQKADLEDTKQIWQSYSRRMSVLRDAARNLFGFESPFANRIGESSQANAVSLNPNRSAAEGQWRIKVLQIATADRLLSDELPLDATAPAGDYRFKVGDQEVTVNFRGGRLSNLVEAINQRGRDLIRASLIRTTADRQVLSIEAQKTGSQNRLEFFGAARDFVTQAGLMRPSRTTDQTIPLTAETTRTRTAPESVTLSENQLTLQPRARAEVLLNRDVSRGLVLEVDIQAERLSQEEVPAPPPGLNLEPPGVAEFQDIRIRSNPLRTGLPRFEPPTPQQPTNDPRVGQLRTAERQIDLPNFPLEGGSTTLKVPLEGIARLDQLILDNRNTHMRYTLTQIRLVDPNARGDLEPKNAQTTAQDAVFEIDGVRVTRPTNSINDVIPNVTINLSDTTPAPATVKVTPDYESIKNGIINFVGNYNRFMLETLVLTSRNEAILNEANYLSDAEREALRKNMGKFQGDTSLNQLRSSLQRFMMEPYPSGVPNISLLQQVGISTNTSGRTSGSTPEAARLRGYLEINEGQLDQAIRENLVAVKNLFGMDTNGDLVIDSGAAFRVDEYIRPYVQTGGFIANRVNTLNSQIDRQNREIRNFNDYLVRYEQDLKRRYGQMEGALNRMQETGRAIDNFSRQNSGGN